MRLSKTTKGILSIAGGFVQNFGLGVFYVWGAMAIYVISYYRLLGEPNLDIDISVAYLPLSTFPSSLAMLFTVPISNKIGIKKTLLIGSIGVAASSLLASFMPGFWSYVAFFAVVFGLFEGLIFLLPLFVGFSYFPSHTGLVSGIINTGFGLGILGANTISLKIMNPENQPPSLRDVVTGDLFFRWDVAYKVPFLTQIFAIYLLVILILSSFMVFENKEESSQDETLLPREIEISSEEGLVEDVDRKKKSKKREELTNKIEKRLTKELQELANKEIESRYPTVWSAMKTRQFLCLLAMSFFSTGFPFLITIHYKNYGITKISDDEFITWVASIANIFNGGLRILWGNALDRFGFKKVYSLTLMAEIIVCATFPFVAHMKAFFLVWMTISFVSLGIHFVIFHPEMIKIFGLKIGTSLMSYIYFAFCFSTLFQFFLMFTVNSYLGFEPLLWLEVGLLGIPLGLLGFFKDE